MELFCAAAELRGYTGQVTAAGEVAVTCVSRVTAYYLANLLGKVSAAPQQEWAALGAGHLGTGPAHNEATHGAVLLTPSRLAKVAEAQNSGGSTTSPPHSETPPSVLRPLHSADVFGLVRLPPKT